MRIFPGISSVFKQWEGEWTRTDGILSTLLSLRLPGLARRSADHAPHFGLEGEARFVLVPFALQALVDDPDGLE